MRSDSTERATSATPAPGAVMRRRALEWLFWLGCWALVGGTIAPIDLLLGAVTVTAVLAAAVAVSRMAGIRLDGRLAWLRHLRRLPLRIGLDTVAVTREALRRLAGGRSRGRLHDVPFRARGDDARTVARRAVVVTAVSLTPNSVVADVQPDRDVGVVHTFTGGIGAPGDPRWPLLS